MKDYKGKKLLPDIFIEQPISYFDKDLFEEMKKGMITDVMPHQCYALRWMMYREVIPYYRCKGGFLSHEMGLGKTYTVLLRIYFDKLTKKFLKSEEAFFNDSPTLVISSREIINVWKSQIASHFKHGSLTFLEMGENKKIFTEKDLKKYDIVFITYELLSVIYTNAIAEITKKIKDSFSFPTHTKCHEKNRIINTENIRGEEGEGKEEEEEEKRKVGNFKFSPDDKTIMDIIEEKIFFTPSPFPNEIVESLNNNNNNNNTQKNTASHCHLCKTKFKDDYRCCVYNVKWRRIVCDEIHNIRGMKKKFRACISLHSEIFWGVTGTPLQNGKNDLIPIYRFVHFWHPALFNPAPQHNREDISKRITTQKLLRSEKNMIQPRFYVQCNNVLALFRNKDEVGYKPAETNPLRHIIDSINKDFIISKRMENMPFSKTNYGEFPEYDFLKRYSEMVEEFFLALFIKNNGNSIKSPKQKSSLDNDLSSGSETDGGDETRDITNDSEKDIMDIYDSCLKNKGNEKKVSGNKRKRENNCSYECDESNIKKQKKETVTGNKSQFIIMTAEFCSKEEEMIYKYYEDGFMELKEREYESKAFERSNTGVSLPSQCVTTNNTKTNNMTRESFIAKKSANRSIQNTDNNNSNNNDNKETQQPIQIPQLFSRILPESFNNIVAKDNAALESEIFNREIIDEIPLHSIQDNVSTHILVYLTRIRQVCIHPIVSIQKQLNDMAKNSSNSKYDIEEETKRIMRSEWRCLSNEQIENLYKSIFVKKDFIPTKFRMLRYYIENVMKKNEKLVIFTNYNACIQPIINFLKEHMNIRSVAIYGDVKYADRIKYETMFDQDNETMVLVTNIVMSSVGKNFQRANHVIIFEPTYNPELENQALDRVDRLGQKNNYINKVYMLMFNTMEERVHRLATKKCLEICDITFRNNVKYRTELLTKNGNSFSGWKLYNDTKEDDAKKYNYLDTLTPPVVFDKGMWKIFLFLRDEKIRFDNNKKQITIEEKKKKFIESFTLQKYDSCNSDEFSKVPQPNTNPLSNVKWINPKEKSISKKQKTTLSNMVFQDMLADAER